MELFLICKEPGRCWACGSLVRKIFQFAVLLLMSLFFAACVSPSQQAGFDNSKVNDLKRFDADRTTVGLSQPSDRQNAQNRDTRRLAYSSKKGGVSEIKASGVYRYGPRISESRACANAKTEMQRNAIRQAVGVSQNRDSTLSCSSKLYKATGTDCLLLDVMWDAAAEATLIRDVQIEEQKVYTVEGGSECRVSGTVRLERLGEKKETFIVDLKVLPSQRLRDGQELSFHVTSAKTAFHYIYSYQNDSDEAQLLFPNEYEGDNKFVGERLIPSQGLENKVYFEASLPENEAYALEYLLMISAEKDLGVMPDKMRIGKLREKVAGLAVGYLTLTKSFYEIE